MLNGILINSDKTTVFLAPEQVALFRLFTQHYDAIDFMLKSGVFDMKQGNVVLSFDQKGRLKSIKRELYSYAEAI
jgi:hypothetical protein